MRYQMLYGGLQLIFLAAGSADEVVIEFPASRPEGKYSIIGAHIVEGRERPFEVGLNLEDGKDVFFVPDASLQKFSLYHDDRFVCSIHKEKGLLKVPELSQIELKVIGDTPEWMFYLVGKGEATDDVDLSVRIGDKLNRVVPSGRFELLRMHSSMKDTQGLLLTESLTHLWVPSANLVDIRLSQATADYWSVVIAAQGLEWVTIAK